VFQLSPNGNGTWTETVLHAFVGADGSQPTGAVTLDSQGNLYGTTYSGGSYGLGVVYEIAGGQLSVLHSFAGTQPGSYDGANSNATLTFDLGGNLWGTTTNGGDRLDGTVFVLTPQNGAWQYSVFHSFQGAASQPHDGVDPESGVVIDSLGNLWGTTAAGGYAGVGTFYEIKVSE